MSTKDRPQQEDKHIVASSDVENGLQDHEKTIDFASEANEAIFGALEVVIDSSDDNNTENGRIIRFDDPPDGLGGNENSVEEKLRETKRPLQASVEPPGLLRRLTGLLGARLPATRQLALRLTASPLPLSP